MIAIKYSYCSEIHGVLDDLEVVGQLEHDSVHGLEEGPRVLVFQHGWREKEIGVKVDNRV